MINLKLIHETTKHFRTKVRPITVKTQRNIYKGLIASRLSKKNNPALAAKKAFYRHMYLLLKQREQQMYGSKAKSLSMSK